eukprot:TRINITY_DN3796_c0_g1_i2.p1 TRINITY_DN3796_c0_g1~~TRINITY_DN3796_c0_g1_i2.p1  ORF type:complete len:262 (+),score=28.21 TRINITY_DN3796_c0_g1_i2:27-788(+)
MTSKTSTIKLVFFGASSSGKTPLIQRFITEKFPENSEPTIGSEFSSKTISYSQPNRVKLDIWDVSGSDHFAELSPLFYLGSQVVVVTFSPFESTESFEKAKKWVTNLQACPEKLEIFLVATKIDLQENRVVPKKQSEQFAESHQLQYLEVSAKTNFNIALLFTSLVTIGLECLEESKDSKGEDLILRPDWVPDSSAKQCNNCSSEFTFANRRHHCRKCGQIFCAKCTANKIQLSDLRYHDPVRVCESCFKSMK